MRKPRPSYLQYAAIDAAWRALMAAYDVAGPTARKRFDGLRLLARNHHTPTVSAP